MQRPLQPVSATIAATVAVTVAAMIARVFTAQCYRQYCILGLSLYACMTLESDFTTKPNDGHVPFINVTNPCTPIATYAT